MSQTIKLTDSERHAIAEEARAELASRSYENYFQYANFGATLYPHTKLICEKLQPIIDGQQKFYIVEMPPQHGKSLTITETFPSYFLMKHPDKRVMVTAYSQSLYTKFSEANRRKFEAFAPKIAGLETSKSTGELFNIADHRGSFYATSILGGGTGRSADLLIIDDPVKNAEEANSKTVKEKIVNEWQQTFFPRVQKGGSIIVIMTRWAVDDLAGTLLKQGALPWEEIKLPAIAEDIPDGQTDAIGRHNGEPLCADLHPLSDLKVAQINNGSHAFAAMYQQRPTLQGGNIFKLSQVHFYLPDTATASKLGLDHDDDIAILPKLDKVWSSWDLTFTDKDSSDFVAGQTWGKSQANFYLLDRVHGRMDFNGQLSAIQAMHNRQPEASAIYIEDKANGSAIINTMRRYISGIIPVVPKGDKVTRANVVVPFFEAGNVYLPHPKWQPWVREMLDEWTGFPNMEHDDEVDSMTQALSREVIDQPQSVMLSHDSILHY